MRCTSTSMVSMMSQTRLRRDGGGVVGHVTVNIDVNCLLAADSLEHLLRPRLDASLAGGVAGLVR